MAFRMTYGLILALVASMTLQAGEIKINPDHPDHYTVAKGDTLWEIAGRFLQQPAQWPKIWHVNPQIKNPNLIYPGDTLTFSMVNGKPQLNLSRHQKLYPRTRETQIEEAIKLIPYERIQQFLTSPRVVAADELSEAPYVVEFANEHLIAGAGDQVYVRAIENPQALSYTLYRPGATFTRSETDEVLGYEAVFVADVSLQEAGDPATLKIVNSSSEVRMGDRIMTKEDGEFTLNYFPRPPKNDIKGTIISVLDGLTEIGRYNIVAIDRGIVDGLKIGHVLDIYQRGEIVADPYSPIKNDLVKLPDERAGTLMVFRTFERVSYALIMEAKRSLHLLDKVETP